MVLGFDVLDKLEKIPVDMDDNPKKTILVADCGEVKDNVAKEAKETKEAKGTQETKETKGAKEAQEAREAQINAELGLEDYAKGNKKVKKN
jgi:hypothetical protein